MRHYLAFDLGAESGRAMLGTLEGGRLALEELHRFSEHAGARVRCALLGHAAALARDPARPGHRRTRSGSCRSPASASIPGASISRCSARMARWPTIRATIAMRAPTACMEKLFAVVPRAEVFAQTGIQFMQLNSLYQFYAHEAGRIARAGCRAHAAVHAGPVQLLADRRGAARS